MKRLIGLAALVALAGGAQAADEKVDFAKQILPIFQERCFECHGPNKDKGHLRLHTKKDAFEHDDVIKPGNSKESEMYIRITLAADSDDIMPPKGDPLSKEATDLIKRWIDGGADWPENVVTVKEEKKEQGPMDKLAAVKPDAAEAKAIEALEGLGVSVRPVARDLVWKTANLRSLDLKDVKTALGHLSQVKTLTDLNLASRELTDADLKAISGLTSLTRLHLENNKITDAGVAELKGMAHLDYLNLYGTEVSDAGLANLKGMKDLRKVFLWQTKVTDDGVAALKKDLPALEVIRGWEPAAVVAKAEEPKKEEAKPEAKKEEPKKEVKKAEEKKEEPKKEEKKDGDKK